jgi:hypothetical protein
MMRMLVVGLAAIAWTASASAQKKIDYTETLRKGGFKYCAPSVQRVAEWIVDNDGGSIGLWRKTQADARTGLLLLAKQYSDGVALATVTGVRTQDGGCDVHFTHTIPMAGSCAAARESTFKDWKYFGDAASQPFYEDPTSGNVQVTLVATGSSCLVQKTGVLFYSASDVAEANKP